MKKLSVLLVLPLAACIRFGPATPDALLTLTATSPVPVGQTQQSAGGRPITVLVPSVPQSVAVTRVPVQSSETQVAYVKDAQWVEQPARLFARLVSDTVTARTGRVVLGQRQSLTDPGAILSGELRSFGIDATRSEAVVVYDATLQRTSAQTFEKRRFEGRAPVPVVDAATVGPALNQAANQVAAEVSDWVGR